MVFLRPLETMISRPLHGRMTQNNTGGGFYRHLAMTLPSQSQFDSALTKTDLAEIFKCRKIRTTGALLRIRSSREAAAARQPDRMGQRHSLRPVRPRSRPGPLATGPYVVFLQQSGRYPRWESKIELGEKFFQEIINHPVPLNLNTLNALKRSALGLDLYLWWVYRTFPLRAPLRLTWRLLYSQFGAHPDKASDKRTVLNFRYKVLRELKKIKLAWPELNYATAKGVLILLPSTPAITPVEQAQLTS